MGKLSRDLASLSGAGASSLVLADAVIAAHMSAGGVKGAAFIGDSDGCGELCENGTWKLLR